MKTRIASCSCGGLNVTCTGEPIRISMCHCHACQRRTGSVFAVQVRFPRERVVVEGETRTYERVGDEGSKATFRFCPSCGATVFWENDSMPDNVAVAVGAFADATIPPPTVSVYDVRRHPWTEMPALASAKIM